MMIFLAILALVVIVLLLAIAANAKRGADAKERHAILQAALQRDRERRKPGGR